MTIEEVLAQVDELRPNQYSDTIKVSWLSKLDAKIYDELISRYYEEPEIIEEPEEDEENKTREGENPEGGDGDGEENVPILPDVPDHDFDNEEENKDLNVFNGYTVDDISQELLVCDSYADLYVDYIFAMIDYNNQELDRYNNSYQMFNSKLFDYKNYYNRTHRFKRKPLVL